MTATTIEAPLDLRTVWLRWRWPAVVVVLVIAAGVVLAAIQNAAPERPLDPRDASPVGARALAELLRQRGVAVTPIATVPEEPAAATVFVPDPQSLRRSELARLNQTTANVVLVAPSHRELAALAVDARPSAQVKETSVDPRCGLPTATTAGDIRFGGTAYAPGPQLASCYPVGGGSGLLAIARADHFVAVVGSSRVWTNGRLGDNGDAALALGLLSTQPTLLWVLPRPPTQSPSDREHKSLFELLPDRLLWALLQLLVVVLLLALWRARRLGPVVGEPIPVVVPSAETVRGRARLLRAARARGAAADELRTATVRRLEDALGLGHDAPRAAVVAGVTAHTDRTSGEIEALLFGAEPPDDASLVTLANALDDIESTMKGWR
ncbi:MAG TPA: DUF4350 domain-containing protein [Amycolatopsis sp.]|uniref:DUF4350 domain-containing protein n=1 Tax=Amycolatopsis sp. TaxID=37632 RepID=UPI002F42C3F6